MKRQHLLSCLLMLVLSVLALPAFAAPDPTEQMKPFVDKIIAQLKQPEFRKETADSQTRKIVALASEHFDFQEMSKRVVGKAWQTLTPAQQEQFVSLFTRLLQRVYIGQVDSYIEKKIEFVGQRIKDGRVEVKSQFVDAQKNIPVSYILLLKGDKWMAYDIVVEGVSLVRNYMEQIQSVLREKQFAGLTEMLENKIKELEAQAGAKP